jgi:predicted dienelactone hydrolase
MQRTQNRAPAPNPVAPAPSPRRRARLLVALIGALLVSPAAGALPAAASDAQAADLRVGYRVERIVVSGSAQGERRQVDVHLWYPADQRRLGDAGKARYSSVLHGLALPAPWAPLSWTVDAEIAREDANEEPAIDPHGAPFPVILFSHGSVNDPIDYAHTLELIAGAGFVVAAPSHVNNTQDDVRIDFINAQAGATLFLCRDGRPGPCSRPNVPFSLADRVRDVSEVLDTLPAWFGGRVDVSRAGVLGHSRGTATALAAAGGSAPWNSVDNCLPSGPLCWPLAADPRVKAIMGLAIAAPRITRGANLANIRVPALLVAGGLDETSPAATSEFAFRRIESSEKAYVLIPKAEHRSFDSTYCDQTQAAGAIAQANPNAILDRHTIAGTVVSAAAPLSGKAMDYCDFATFTSPVDIRPLVAELSGFNVTPDNVPTSGLDTDEVKHGVKELAVAFFGTVLKRTGNDGPHFTRYLAPKWLQKHETMVGRAEAFAGADAVCPPGQDLVCAD